MIWAQPLFPVLAREEDSKPIVKRVQSKFRGN